MANPNQATGSSWSSFQQKLNPLAKSISKGFVQAKQWSEEKLGTASEVTELPADYLELERRVDVIRNLHQELVKVTKAYAAPYGESSLPEGFSTFSRSLTDTFQNASSAVTGAPSQPTPEPTEPSAPRTEYHAYAKASFQGAASLGTEDPFGTVLMKFGSVHDKIGDSRLRFLNDVQKRVITPLNSSLNTTIQLAMKARRNVLTTRLELDGLKASYKNVKPEKVAQAKQEIDAAEDSLVLAVEEAIVLMKAVVESPEPLRNLSDLVTSQIDFYKEAYELLADISPEIEEIQSNQEAIYRNNYQKNNA